MTPTPQKFVDEAREIVRRCKLFPGDSLSGAIALALQTSHDEGVREGRQQERDLMKKFTEEISK